MYGLVKFHATLKVKTHRKTAIVGLPLLGQMYFFRGGQLDESFFEPRFHSI